MGPRCDPSPVTAGGSSIPEVHRLLAALVASKPDGRIAEIGTAFGAGARAIAAALMPGATFVTVEPDPGRVARARDALSGTRTEVIDGPWEDVLPHRGPFDVIFFDGSTGAATLPLAISLLAPGGVLVKDDLTLGRPVAGDAVREALLRDERLAGVVSDALGGRYASSGFSGSSSPRASTPPPARPGRGRGRGA
jgi:predicted O-methyltransferase YrrM